MNRIKAYKEIISAFKKNKDIIADDNFVNTQIKYLENRIEIAKLVDLFKIDNLPQGAKPSFVKIYGHFAHIMYYADNENYISWPDDGRQPKNEYLYSVSFPTGAHIFGEFYPEELFNEFFGKLKKYNPKYCDSKNHYLYFSPENAYKLHNDFKGIYENYVEKAGALYRKERKEKLEEELKKLEN